MRERQRSSLRRRQRGSLRGGGGLGQRKRCCLRKGQGRGLGEGHRERAVAVLCTWLRERVGEVTAPARHANAMSELLMSDASVRTPEQAAARLAVSVRTLQRMAHRHVGLSPAAIIRRRRLQEAAERIRTDPDADLATVAAELGYADQAHLAKDFRAVLGITASSYRAGADPGRS